MPELKLKKLLKEHPSLVLSENKEKVKCSLTGHEIPAKRLDMIEMYVKGKKYLRVKAKADTESQSYMKHLEPPRKKVRKNQLYCKLTGRHINNLPHHIERHVKGKRFLKALDRWEECQKTGAVFKPLRQQPKVRDEMEDESMNSNMQTDDDMKDLYPENDPEMSEDELEDDLSDLYPGEDFASESDQDEDNMNEDNEEDSDFDFDSMEVEPDRTDANTVTNNTVPSTKLKATEKRTHEEVTVGKKKSKGVQKAKKRKS